jgi:hypothetical protein
VTDDLKERLGQLVGSVDLKAEALRHRDDHELHPDGLLKEPYNAALILTQCGLATGACERILEAAVFHPSNKVRERVYQDFGSAERPSPVFLRLLLAAIEDEGEVLLGKPGLYRTLDRIGSLSEDGLVTVLDVCDQSSSDDVVGFCCGIIHRALQSAGVRLSADLFARCCFSVSRALAICVFDSSDVGLTRSGKMYDDVFDALSVLAETADDAVPAVNTEAYYPWQLGIPGYRSLRAERARGEGDLLTFLAAAGQAGVRELAHVLSQLAIATEIGKAESKANPKACAERILLSLAREEARYRAFWNEAMRAGLALNEAYAFSDKQFLAVKYITLLKRMESLVTSLRESMADTGEYDSLLAFVQQLSATDHDVDTDDG